MSEDKRVEVKLKIPGPDSPGFLNRAQRASDLQIKLARDLKAETMTVETVTAIADFLKDYVEVPDGEDAREAILNLSQNELDAAMSAMTGAFEDEPVKKAKDTD